MTSANVGLHVGLGLEDDSHGHVIMCASDPNLDSDMQIDYCIGPTPSRQALDISSDATSCSSPSNLCHSPRPTVGEEVYTLEGRPTPTIGLPVGLPRTHPTNVSNSEFSDIDLEIDRETHISRNKDASDLLSVGSLNMHLDVDVELSTGSTGTTLSKVYNDNNELLLENKSEMCCENEWEKEFPLENKNITSSPEMKQRMECSDLSFGKVDNQLPSPLKSIHTHPAYKTVIQELLHSKEQIVLLNKKINVLELENRQLNAEANSSREIYEVQLETLEKTVNQQQSELQQLSELNQQQAETSSKTHGQMKHDLEAQLERMTKMYDSANKDREATVMRYAVSEKEVIGLRKERESSEKRMKEVVKEKDVLIGKLKSLTAEKDRVIQTLDHKCHELMTVQKDNERLKEDLNSREIKIKWAQNKLCTELEAHKETQAKLDKLSKKLQDTKEESEQVHRDCQSMMRAFQTSEENKAFTLGQQLKEQQATLILERHERQAREETLRQLSQEVDTLKGKHQLIINENNLLSIKVQNLEKERLEYEQNLSKLKRTTDDQRQDVVDLRSQLAEMESIRIQLQHEQEKLTASHGEVERLRLSNAELQQDMAACREREAELLDFTQKLTDKNVRLQSEFSATEAKAQQLECELGPQLKHASELETRVCSLSQQLDRERRQRLEESQLLARHLAEKTQRADSLSQQLEDQVGENQVLKRKQAATVKELMRELNQTRKRLELSDTLSGNTSLGQSSRASSSSSLNTIEQPPSNTSNAVRLGPVPTEITSNGSEHSSGPLEPDRQLLIERIVKLQRANARKTEKLEFMEEHSRQLVSELQKKTRVVQSYIMREQSGALSSDSMDRNKAELTRHGGIMASVYGSKALDDNMTLELSLEINRKLQAVLEDTLLKNITLKESIDTLGAEISRLQQESHEKT